MKIPRVLDALLHTFLIINQSAVAKRRTPNSAHLRMRPLGKGKAASGLSRWSGPGPRSAGLCSPEPPWPRYLMGGQTGRSAGAEPILSVLANSELIRF